MNKIKLILIFFFIISFSFAQKQEKIANTLLKEIENKGTDKNFTVWIFFKDKGEITDKKLNSSKSLLSKHSLERRQKLLKSKPLVDFYDIPVEISYINSVKPYISKLRHQSKWLNAVSAEVNGIQLQNIASLNCVKSIDIVRKGKYNNNLIQGNEIKNETSYKSTAYNLNYGASLTQSEQINVPIIHDLGYSGNGIIICLLDAGFNNLEHQVFENINILDQWDFVNNDGNVDDESDMGSGSHGTMTLSTIGGFYEGQLIGTAYGASYLLAKTENTDSETQVEEDNWVAGVEWAEALGADITSTSLGYISFDDGSGYSAAELDGNTAIITIAGDIAAGKGVLVVNSAGNEGSGITTIIAPADGDSILTVGAVYSDGNRTYFSSVGPTGDGRIKPDVMAMGASVVVAETSGNGYTTSSGTSFSCPIVAGATALLREIFPFASNMEIIDALKKTANNTNSPNNEYGWGIIDLFAAYNYLIPKNSYSASFNVINKENSVENAEIIFKTNKQTTDVRGYAVFQDILADKNIEYRISKPGFCTYYDTIPSFNRDINITVELIETSVLVYPAPASNYIIFDIKEDEPNNNSLLFYNLKGQIIKSVNKYENKSKLDISSLAAGIYFVQIKINNSVYLKKVIISR
ncbi:MAG: S8 family peptidase [Bacteroidales bacterium]|nr:S8 family peptidase [Bacteroidales bacterium]